MITLYQVPKIVDEDLTDYEDLEEETEDNSVNLDELSDEELEQHYLEQDEGWL